MGPTPHAPRRWTRTRAREPGPPAVLARVSRTGRFVPATLNLDCRLRVAPEIEPREPGGQHAVLHSVRTPEPRRGALLLAVRNSLGVLRRQRHGAGQRRRRRRGPRRG